MRLGVPSFSFSLVCCSFVRSEKEAVHQVVLPVIILKESRVPVSQLNNGLSSASSSLAGHGMRRPHATCDTVLPLRGENDPLPFQVLLGDTELDCEKKEPMTVRPSGI